MRRYAQIYDQRSIVSKQLHVVHCTTHAATVPVVADNVVDTTAAPFIACGNKANEPHKTNNLSATLLFFITLYDWFFYCYNSYCTLILISFVYFV